MKVKILGAISVIATLFAVISSSTASVWLWYQPREPKAVKSRR